MYTLRYFTMYTLTSFLYSLIVNPQNIIIMIKPYNNVSWGVMDKKPGHPKKCIHRRHQSGGSNQWERRAHVPDPWPLPECDWVHPNGEEHRPEGGHIRHRLRVCEACKGRRPERWGGAGGEGLAWPWSHKSDLRLTVKGKTDQLGRICSTKQRKNLYMLCMLIRCEW